MTIDLTMSVFGVLAFSTLKKMMVLTQNFRIMMINFIFVVVGVALVGRMVPNSVLQGIAFVE